MKKTSLVSLLLLVSLLVTALVPLGNVSAGTDVVKGAVPTLISPIGLILDRTPTFKWNKVASATFYKLEVFEGSTKVFGITLGAGTVCGATTCAYTRTSNLGYRPYSWRLAAYVSPAWGSFSAFKDFTISSPSFTSYFNGNMAGWSIFKGLGGLWYTAPTYIYTPGKMGVWSNLYRSANDGKYNDFLYTATFKRVGGNTSTKSPANCLMVRMGAKYTSGSYQWVPGYRFCVNNLGKYEVWYQSDLTGETYSIAPWTFSPVITKNGWNTLQVLAVGSHFEFYINGTNVKNFTDTSKDRGYVGLSMVRFDSTFNTQFQADYASLTVQGLTGDIKADAPQAVLVPVTAEEVMGSD